MNIKKSILVISQVYPFPMHDGGRVDIYQRLKTLKRLGFDVTLVAFYNPNIPFDPDDNLHEICDKVFPLPYLRRKLSKILTWKPYSIASRENLSEINKIIQTLKSEDKKFDFIISESSHVISVAEIFRKSFDIKQSFLRSHNNEPKFMLSVAQSSSPFSIIQIFFLIESIKYKFYEKFLMFRCNKINQILHISYDELVRYQKKLPNIEQIFLPAGIDVREMKQYIPKMNCHVLFLGALFSPNNLHGVAWYLKHIHARVIKEIPGYKLIIAGSTGGMDKRQIHDLLNNVPQIEFYDSPKNVEELYENSAVFINPMRYGAGVKLKSINAIVNAMPVVTTQIGNEGTGLKNVDHVLINDDPDDFAQSVINLLKNEAKRSLLVNASQNYIQKTYHPDELLKKIFY